MTAIAGPRPEGPTSSVPQPTASAIASPRLSVREQRALAILEAIVAEEGWFELSDEQLHSLCELRNQAEGCERWDLDTDPRTGDLILYDAIKAAECEREATLQLDEILDGCWTDILASARTLVGHDIDAASIATELQRDHNSDLCALASWPRQAIAALVTAVILESAVTLFFDARDTGERGDARAWARVERLARELGRAWQQPTAPDTTRAWPFLAAMEPTLARLTTLTALERLAAERSERLQLFQAAALACVRNATYGTPGRWRPVPTAGPYFRVALART
jgi:hypothetical protein